MPETSFPEIESELIVGLVNAIGCQKKLVIDLLTERLNLAGYTVHFVKVSKDVIQTLTAVDAENTDYFKRTSNLMDAGNRLREDAAKINAEQGDAILALGVATHISAKRTKLAGRSDEPQPLPKTAFILDSLKRPEEVEALRLIYPSGFILLGIHEDESRRLNHLTHDLGISAEDARNLIFRDTEESKIDHGQRVNNTFHLADFFVRVSDAHDRLRWDVTRMVELWFGNPFITPTFDEHAMFMAFAAALRSADLSRQVGAVITRDRQILSTGANDCPAPGGGLYWPSRLPNGCIGDVEKGRDYKRENGDSNRAELLRMIERIVSAGKKMNLDEQSLRILLKESEIGDITEFGRVVHAEMEALIGCARNGLSTVGATLFCTTFPCHNCAKHIVAAGIERVVYVEPYPKSKALELHDDSIELTSNPACNLEKRVKFNGFVGIGPRRFFDLFSMNLSSSYRLVRKDKETGKQKDWDIRTARLRIQMNPTSYLELEALACNLLKTFSPAEVRPTPIPPPHAVLDARRVS